MDGEEDGAGGVGLRGVGTFLRVVLVSGGFGCDEGWMGSLWWWFEVWVTECGELWECAGDVVSAASCGVWGSTDGCFAFGELLGCDSELGGASGRV